MSNKIEEYNHLYKEIHANTNRIPLAINLIYTATGELIAYGLTTKSDESELISLTPFLLIIPITFYIYSPFNGIARLAAYIRVFHEGEKKWSSLGKSSEKI